MAQACFVNWALSCCASEMAGKNCFLKDNVKPEDPPRPVDKSNRTLRSVHRSAAGGY